MTERSEEVLTLIIHKLQSQGMNNVAIATDLLGGGAVAVMGDAIGTAEASKFLHEMADAVAKEPGLNNTIN